MDVVSVGDPGHGLERGKPRIGLPGGAGVGQQPVKLGQGFLRLGRVLFTQRLQARFGQRLQVSKKSRSRNGSMDQPQPARMAKTTINRIHVVFFMSLPVPRNSWTLRWKSFHPPARPQKGQTRRGSGQVLTASSGFTTAPTADRENSSSTLSATRTKMVFSLIVTTVP